MGYSLPAQFQRSAAHDYLAAIGWPAIDDTPEPPARLPDQVQHAYELLRNGHTEVEVRLAIQDKFGKGAKPTQAFKRGLDLVVQEQRAAREHLPELVQAIRLSVLSRAIQSGQLGAAAAVLRDLAPVDAALDASSATLLVEVLQPGSGALQPLPEPSEAA
jgi:hypothetical protein